MVCQAEGDRSKYRPRGGRSVAAEQCHEFIRRQARTGAPDKFGESTSRPRAVGSLDNDAAVAGTPKDYFCADSQAQIVPNPLWNCDSAILRNFGHGDLGDVPLDQRQSSKIARGTDG